ncbi:MAG: hypothetical protein DRJ01_18775, partial [Bacteroidetes bacterium]
YPNFSYDEHLKSLSFSRLINCNAGNTSNQYELVCFNLENKNYKKSFLKTDVGEMFHSVQKYMYHKNIFFTYEKIVIEDNNNRIQLPLPVSKLDERIIEPTENQKAIFDKENNIFFISPSSGLIKFNPEDSMFIQFTTQEGLSTNNIFDFKISPDSNSLWLLTQVALHKIKIASLNSKRKLDIKTWTEVDGIELGFKLEFENDSILTLYSDKGYTNFNTKVKGNIIPPQIHFTDLRVYYEEVDWNNVKCDYDSTRTIPQHINFEYNRNHITFDFQGVSQSSKLIYSYKLIGEDKGYHNTPYKSVTYTNLASGKYTFVVKAINKDGVESQEILVDFEIATPFWKTIWFISLLIFVFILGLYTFYKVRVKKLEQRQKELEQTVLERTHEIQEANEELNQQNEEIITQRDQIEEQRDMVVQQKEEIEEIHHEISESINYATRLQGAILPEEKTLDKYLSEHFVLFKPKDKVSGDFYWWSHIENHTVITAADSTGHGVPGAFMSMLGASFLREIVEKEFVTHTGVILRKLRKEIIKALKQTGEVGTQKDGMDMAIISINHETNVVQFSGANNPLYILTNRELTDLSPLEGFENFYEIKPDKMPIAIYEKMDNFTAHEIQLEKGDVLYMFSDGYADQFGGAKGKKFKYKPFKRLLSENRDKPMKEQKELLDKAFESWRGDLEQIDDVVVLGVKI